MRYLLIVLFIVSLGANYFLFNQWQTATHVDKHFAGLEKKFPYLSKRVLADIPQDIRINFLPLRTKLHEISAPYEDKFGLYFEYLPTGTSIGINSQQPFLAASLFKLPVVMAYFRHKESIKKDTDPTVTLTQDMLDDRFGDLYKKGPGYKINLKDAVNLAITESDNTAVRAIVPEIAKEDFDSVYEGLDITLDVNNIGAIITAKQYGSILKALFFSAVLTREHSEQILELLTKTKFSDKIPAGIPTDVTVAHKIGVVDLPDQTAYMDCGIVYVPRRPYLLCMISETDDKTAQARMKTMSQTVYDFVSKF